MLFAIDDQFDSYTSVANLFSLQYEMYLHEQGKEQTSLYRMTTNSDPAPEDVTALRVVPGTRDAIGFLYAFRAADWTRIPELRAPVFDGRRLYDAVARIDTPQGTVTVPAGNFLASRIAIRLFDHGKELTDTRLWVWLAKDTARTPALVEAGHSLRYCPDRTHALALILNRGISPRVHLEYSVSGGTLCLPDQGDLLDLAAGRHRIGCDPIFRWERNSPEIRSF